MAFSSDHSGNFAAWTAIPTDGFSKIMLNLQNLLWTLKKSNLHSICSVFCIWIYLWSNFVHFVTVAHRFNQVVFTVIIPDVYFRRWETLYMTYSISLCSNINSILFFRSSLRKQDWTVSVISTAFLEIWTESFKTNKLICFF